MIYIGVTSNLIKRIFEHKEGKIVGFTALYKVHLLVYYEEFDDIAEAIHREKQLKAWKRQWKIELIDKYNPEWKDLYDKLL